MRIVLYANHSETEKSMDGIFVICEVNCLGF